MTVQKSSTHVYSVSADGIRLHLTYGDSDFHSTPSLKVNKIRNKPGPTLINLITIPTPTILHRLERLLCRSE